MNKIENTLWDNYEAIDRLIQSTEIDKKEYSMLLEERDKIRNELINIDQFDQEIDVKISQIECDNIKDKIRNGITIGTFIISTGVSVYAISKTFKFDQVATITSTLGRGILNGVIPKMGKK